MLYHSIPAIDPTYVVGVAWDNQHSTFTAYVEVIDPMHHAIRPLIFWIGWKYTGEIPAPEFLVAPLAQYAKLTEQHIAKLRADREYDLGVDRAYGEALARQRGSG
jgi:hypothetical protein